MSHCTHCLLPGAAPGARLDAARTCNHCAAFSKETLVRDDARRVPWREDLHRTFKAIRGQGSYDCILNLSGGKDSCYLLHRLVNDYQLKVLAFTCDMHVPDVAWRNIRRTVKSLDVEHQVYKPPKHFYRKLFRFLLSHQDPRGAVRTVCYVCAPLFEGYALNLAVEKGIPLVLAGYSPGQPEPERMEYEFKRSLIEETDWTPIHVRASGLFTADELSLFWNPYRYPAGTSFPRYLAPFHALPYSQEEVMREVVKLGLISNRRSASPVHSNCPVNWLLMYSDLKHLGYNPYAPEFARLIREGKAHRGYWKIMLPIVNFMIRNKIALGRNVKTSLEWLGMHEDELRIKDSSLANRIPPSPDQPPEPARIPALSGNQP